MAIIFAMTTTAQSFTINGPAGSGSFGQNIILLSNGNFVVTDPGFDEGSTLNVGAVYLYSGTTFTPISVLKGSTAEDGVGNVTPLSNGNFLVGSPFWDNGTAVNAGAVTLVNGITGLNGVVSPANSLVGTKSDDQVGRISIFDLGVKALPNSNFVVLSPNWDNGSIVNVGAVTWGSGTTGVTGPVSISNSLIGKRTDDAVGNGGITVLTNNNYLIRSSDWDNTGAPNAGAVTWAGGTSGISGELSSGNSLVGTIANDRMGLTESVQGVFPLTNGNYVVVCSKCDFGAAVDGGAVVWGNGTTGISGPVSTAISIHGAFKDRIGSDGVTALTNGNYVVKSSSWPNDLNMGAATWGNGTTGTTGTVSSSNSLVGSTDFDGIGRNVTALSNGNYVVYSFLWDNGAAADVGAVTFCNGATGTSGTISSSNSLIGSVSNDAVGLNGVVALTNGNYVIASSLWDNVALTDAGAVTWVDGSVGLTGTITSSNSLVGGIADNKVGSGNVIVLSNGNYVVGSPEWDNGTPINIGAATWGNGTTGITGPVSASNSLTGTAANDNVGTGGRIKSLTNGNFVVVSSNWDNGAISNAGAVTLGNGTTGISGTVSSSNSLVGSKANDAVGKQGITNLPNGNYIISSAEWDNGTIVNASAVTWADGTTGVSGPISSANSLIGATTSDFIGGDITGGGGDIITFTNGNYAITSGFWDDGGTVNAGATTWGDASVPLTGFINTCNSIIGGNNVTPVIHLPNQNVIVAGFNLLNKIVVYNPSGMSRANSLDAKTMNIAGSSPVAIIAEGNCRIIASITPNGGSSSVTGSVTAQAWVEGSVPTHAGQPFVARHYQITPAINADAATARVTLYFSQTEFDEFNAHPGSTLNLPTGSGDATGKNNLRIGKYAGTSNNGTGLPSSHSSTVSVIDPDNNDIVWNDLYNRWEVSFQVNGFSGFIVQTLATPLPLKLISFYAAKQTNDVTLNLTTENEQDCSHFNIERSTNGINFTSAGALVARNLTSKQQYQYIDANALTVFATVPKLYYRLKMVDIDGSFTYSSVQVVNLQQTSAFSIYPNPAKDVLHIQLQNNSRNLQLRINDMYGRTLKTWSISNTGTSLQLNIAELSAGYYQLEILQEKQNRQVLLVLKQ